MLDATAFVLLLPLVGFAVLAAGGRRLGDPLAGWLATLAVTASFVLAAVVCAGLFLRAPGQRLFTQRLFTWLPVGGLHVDVAFRVDPLSVTMALFVTGISALIHLYSIGYMRGDPQYPKFFVYLNLFVFSMLLLVLADNFAVSFVGWEGVGACSYWLIAFWFERDSAASAGKKAFVYNRIGDFGFLVAMFFMFSSTGTLSYSGVFAAAGNGHLGGTTATAVALLLFLGAVGKSAQIPLFPWLLDAMEGPTPVSALIHAATMVTAGVYLMVRIGPILALTPVSTSVVAVVGGVTAFVAATAACAQRDIKKVLAFSTVSQLGYMFLAVGSGAYVAAIFLMVTHAFYKALLFLGAGSVIHGLHDEQDLAAMGGLRRLLPVTTVTFGIAWLAIGGVFPLAGFWSKSDVLFNAYQKSPALWALGLLTAVLTAYYIGREFYLAFYGEARWERVAALATTGAGRGPAGRGEPGHAGAGVGAEPHEPPPVMLVPLVVLAGASVLGGLLDLPFHPSWVFLEHWLDPVVGTYLRRPALGAHTEVVLAVADGVAALVGVGLAAGLWRRHWQRPALEPRFLLKGWYFDAAYDAALGRAAYAGAGFTAEVVETRVIDGGVNGAARLVRSLASRGRRIQTGYVRNYALGLTAGAVAVLAWLLSRAGA